MENNFVKDLLYKFEFCEGANFMNLNFVKRLQNGPNFSLDQLPACVTPIKREKKPVLAA